MYFPRRKLLLLFILLTGLTAGLVPLTTKAQNTSPQRLRIRVENRKLKPHEETKVIVEFLDMNYNQVANDVKREIMIGQSGAGTKQTGGGYFKPDRIWVQPGEWSGYATFVSNQSGRVFITAESRGLESARTLVLITESSASFLSQLFETVVYADNDDPFGISPALDKAKANNKDFATFQVSFLKDLPAGTILQISTNLTKGRIMYKGELKGSSVAAIKLDGEVGATDDIQISSGTAGRFEVKASVEGLFSKRAEIIFETPRPSILLFDDAPKAIALDAVEVCVTARLYDGSRTIVDAEQDRVVQFTAANASFDPKVVKISAGQQFAETRMKLTSLPSGNRISILASSEGIESAQKSIPIQSFIHKLLVTGPRELIRGQEAVFTVQLAKEDGSNCPADLDRTIDLSIDGGKLDKSQLKIESGQQQQSIKYTAPADIGSYTLSAFSPDIVKSDFQIKVVHPAYVLMLFSLFGALVGGIARQLKTDRSFERIFPKRVGRKLHFGLTGCLIGSLVAGLVVYLTFKLGLSRALDSRLPATLDVGTRTMAFFLSLIGGYAGTVVLDQVTNWILPFVQLVKRRVTSRQPSAPAVP